MIYILQKCMVLEALRILGYFIGIAMPSNRSFRELKKIRPQIGIINIMRINIYIYFVAVRITLIPNDE